MLDGRVPVLAGDAGETAKTPLAPSAGDHPAPLAPNRFRRWLWFLSTCLVALVATSAVATSIDGIARRWTVIPSLIGPPGWAFLILGLLAGVGFVALTAVVATRSSSSVRPLAFVVVVAVLLRVLAVALIPSPIESDWANYHRLAIEIAAHGPIFASVPTGWPMLLAIPYALFGPEPWFGGLINVAAGAITTGLVFVLTERAFGRRAGAVAGATYAVFPSQLLMTPILAGETVYATLLIATVAAALFALHSASARGWLVAGALLGLSQYVRAVSLIVLPAFAVLPFLPLGGRRSLAKTTLPLVLSFLFVLLPVIVWQRTENGAWSVSTSSQSNWNLFVGLNREYNGFYNVGDELLVGGERGTPEFDVRAGVLARERLLTDPPGLVALAVRKFPLMWGSESYGAYWALLRSKPADQDVALALLDLSQIAWVIVTVGATLTMVAYRNRQPPLGWAMVLILGATALAHTFLEIQGRYHSPLVPLICCVAAPAIGVLAVDRTVDAVRRLRGAPATVRPALDGAGKTG